MSRTLNLVECLTDRARKHQQLGITQEAARCWTRLADLAETPSETACEAQTCLAELHLEHGRYSRRGGI